MPTKTIFYFVLLTVIFTNCKKDSEIYSQTSPPSCGDTVIVNKLIGEWQWIETTGGVANVHENPSNCKCDKKLVFSKDCIMEMYKNNFLTYRQNVYFTWEINKYNEKEGGSYVLHIDSIRGITINFRLDTIYLRDMAADGFSHKYKQQ